MSAGASRAWQPLRVEYETCACGLRGYYTRKAARKVRAGHIQARHTYRCPCSGLIHLGLAPAPPKERG